MENQKLQKAVGLMMEGKEEGFNAVYSATYNRVYFRARQLMKTEQDAEDLVQIVFVEAYKNIASLKEADALFSWLDGITCRQGMKIFRKRWDVLLSEEGEGVFDILENEDASLMPELTADQKATCEILAEIIEELPELQKTAVIAYYYDNRKIEEIAEWMDCSAGTVKSRLNYARKYMKERIEERERKEEYRLHAAGVPMLVFAIRLMSGKMAITGGAAQKIYHAVCRQLGLTASALPASLSEAESRMSVQAGVETGSPASTQAGTETGSPAEAQAGAEAVKTAASSAKAAKIAGLLLAAGVVIGGSVFLANRNRPEEPAAAEEAQEPEAGAQPEAEEIIEEPEEPAVEAEEPEEEPEEDLTWARELYDALMADDFGPVISALEDWDALAVNCQPYLLEGWAESEGENAYRMPVSDTETLGIILYDENGEIYSASVFVGLSDGKDGFETIGSGDKLVIRIVGSGAMEWNMMYTTFDGTTTYEYRDGEEEPSGEYPCEPGMTVAQWHLSAEQKAAFGIE